MRKGWLLIAGLVLVLGIISLTACETGESVSGDTSGLTLNNQQEGIFVSGSGKVSAVPDVATLSLGVQAQDVSVAGAQAQAIDAMNKVMASLTDNGVAKNDIQTQTFNIIQLTRYDDKTQQQVVIGYQVNNTVTAKIKSLDKVGIIIDAVAVAGGDLTRINSISFSIDDPSDYFTEARNLAMADAKAKANQLADLADVTLGKATYITESSYTPPIRPIDLNEKAVGASTTPISPGETEIVTTVQVTFAIR